MLKIKKIKPMFNSIVTTMDKYTEAQCIPGTHITDIARPKDGVKEYQKVLAVGPMVRDVKVGDMVIINPRNYAVHKYSPSSVKKDIENMDQVITYNFNVVVIDSKDCLLLYDRDIDFIVEDFEEV